MTKKGTPEWVDGMNEDVVPKDYWHYGGLNGVSDFHINCIEKYNVDNIVL